MNEWVLRLLIVVAMLAAPISAAEAQSGSQVASTGEKPVVVSCPYDCRNHAGYGAEAREITYLVAMNPGLSHSARILFFGGSANAIAQGGFELAPLDVDEIDICGSLVNGLGNAPAVGMALIWSDPEPDTFVFKYRPPLTPYAYVRNEVDLENPHPHGGTYKGSVSKVECRVVSPSVISWHDLRLIWTVPHIELEFSGSSNP